MESIVHGEGEQFVISITKRKDVRDIMRNPETVLESLKAHAGNAVYRYLYHLNEVVKD
jgi:hypothetical protein